MQFSNSISIIFISLRPLAYNNQVIHIGRALKTCTRQLNILRGLGDQIGNAHRENRWPEDFSETHIPPDSFCSTARNARCPNASAKQDWAILRVSSGPRCRCGAAPPRWRRGDARGKRVMLKWERGPTIYILFSLKCLFIFLKFVLVSFGQRGYSFSNIIICQHHHNYNMMLSTNKNLF